MQNIITLSLFTCELWASKVCIVFNDTVYYIPLSLSIFLKLYPCFAFKKYTGTSKFTFQHWLPVSFRRCTRTSCKAFCAERGKLNCLLQSRETIRSPVSLCMSQPFFVSVCKTSVIFLHFLKFEKVVAEFWASLCPKTVTRSAFSFAILRCIPLQLFRDPAEAIFGSWVLFLRL
jgi:hypothetical protein